LGRVSDDVISAATARALQFRLATAQRDGRVPSVVAAVARRDQPVWFGGAGSVDGAVPTDSVQYRIGSITKTMVAVLVLRLVDRGEITLADPIGDHLPAAPAADSTVYQLLTHTAGLASETPPPWWERTAGTLRPELRDVLSEDPRRHPPGRVHHYSNPGFGLLGALVAAKAGRPWFDVLAEDVLAPLGMTRTTYLPVAPHARGYAVHPWADVVLPEPAHDHGLLAAAGQLWSTPGDLCRFGVFLSGADDQSADDVLGSDLLQAMRTPAVAPNDPLWSGSYGLGVQHLRFGDRVYFGHTGSMPGFLAMMMSSPEDGLTVTMQSNAWSALATRALTGDLFDIVRDREPTMPAAWAATASASDRGAFDLVGPWYWGAVPMSISLRGAGRLELAGLAGAGRSARFRPVGTDRWIGLDGYYHGEFLEVRRDDHGQVTHLDLGSFVFTRAPYAPAEVVPDGLGLGDWL
jgi:CubicO group peptidase (beta-lactamase class C family)